MAGAWGNELWSGSNSWKAGLYADVVSETDTTANIRVRCIWWGRYQFQVPNGNQQYIECDGQTGGWGAARGISGTGEQQISEWTYTVNKTENSRNVRCVAGVHMGGYIVGTSMAECYVAINRFRQVKPNPPANVTITRVDDNALQTTWQGAYDNAARKYWKQVIIDLKTDTPSAQGGWGNKAVVNWDATSYKITGLAANRRYYVALYARNLDADSDHVNKGYFYTTPAAPSNVIVTKTGSMSTSVSVDISNSLAQQVVLYREVNGSVSYATTLTVDPYDKSVSWADSTVPGGNIRYKAVAKVYTYGNTDSNNMLQSSGTWSNGVSTYVQPDPPASMQVARDGNTALNVTWQANYDTSVGKIWDQIRVDVNQQQPPKTTGDWVSKAVLNYTATNYKITGLAANSRYLVRLAAANPAGLSNYVQQGYFYTTPAAPASVTAVKTGNSSVRVTVDVSNSYAQKVVIYRKIDSNNGSSVATLTTNISATSVSFDDTNVPGGVIQYYAQAYVPYTDTTPNSGVYSASTWSNSVTTIQVPKAPTITSPNDTATRVVNSSVTIKWDINHPDGSGQSAAQVEVTYPNSTTSVKYITGGQQSYTIDNLTVGYTKVRVRTKGLHADYGAYSAFVVVRAEQLPNVTILAPTSSSVLRNLPLDVAWSIADSTGVSQQRVTVSDEVGILYDQTVSTSLRTLSLDSSLITPRNNSNLTISISVRGGSGLQSTARSSISVQYTPPASPTVTTTVNADRLTVLLNVQFERVEPNMFEQEYWTFKTDDGASVLTNFVTVRDDDGSSVLIPLSSGMWMSKTEYVTVHRVNSDGSLTLIADHLLDNQQTEDVLAPLNTDITYRVTAYAQSGASKSVDVTTIVDADRSALNFGQDANNILLMPWNEQISRKPQRETVSYDFADGQPYESVYPTGTKTHDISVSGDYRFDQTLYRKLVELAESEYVAWHREASGIVERVRVNQSVSYDWTQKHMRIDYDASMRRVPWQEPVR